MNFLDQLNEDAPSVAGYLDITEIMRLYYGRLDIYVAFSDDDSIPHDGFGKNELLRPYSIMAYTVDTLVGKKVSSSKFYAHVFRPSYSDGSFLKDIRNYSSVDFKEDVEALSVISYIDQEQLDMAVTRVNANPRIRYEFQRIWDLLKILSKDKGKFGDKFWRRLFLDLGYSGFSDYSGIGIMAPKGQSVALFLEDKSLEFFDIVPIQKHRTDKRTNIINRINLKTKRMQAKRNRVAKQKTEEYR